MSERWKLKDRHAVVIGGTRGIDRAVAEELMELGARVTDWWHSYVFPRLLTSPANVSPWTAVSSLRDPSEK